MSLVLLRSGLVRCLVLLLRSLGVSLLAQEVLLLVRLLALVALRAFVVV